MCSVWGSEGGGTGGDRREDGGGERQRRHTAQVCFRQAGNDRGGPGGLARQHDLLTNNHQGKTWVKTEDWTRIQTSLLQLKLIKNQIKLNRTLNIHPERWSWSGFFFCFGLHFCCLLKSGGQVICFSSFCCWTRDNMFRGVETGQYVSNICENVSKCSLRTLCFWDIILCSLWGCESYTPQECRRQRDLTCRRDGQRVWFIASITLFISSSHQKKCRFTKATTYIQMAIQ